MVETTAISLGLQGMAEALETRSSPDGGNTLRVEDGTSLRTGWMALGLIFYEKCVPMFFGTWQRLLGH